MGSVSVFHWLIISVVLFGFFAVPVAVVALVIWAVKLKRGPNLESCPDCGGMVSRLANACPHCGRPLNP